MTPSAIATGIFSSKQVHVNSEAPFKVYTSGIKIIPYPHALFPPCSLEELSSKHGHFFVYCLNTLVDIYRHPSHSYSFGSGTSETSTPTGSCCSPVPP